MTSSSNTSNNLILPKVIAHRGASLEAPENTLAALRRAYELGAQWVEFDVMLTSDNVPIIFHDSYLERTTNGRGKVSETPYKEIAKLDAGSWFSEKYQGEKIPTLAQWLECAAQLGLGINLEMKVRGKRSAKRLANEILINLNQYWSNKLPVPLISSFYKSCLESIYQLAPDTCLGFIISRWTANWRRIIKNYHCVSLHVYHKRLTAKRIALIKNLDLKILTYTIDNPMRAQQLLEMGVDSVFTNNPKL